jgi:DNA-binding transcriptional MerR regulator
MSDLPDKLYYSISEVAQHTAIKPHVLRYWEQEFPSLRPKKNRAGNRSYRQRDVEEVLTIKRLLYEDGFKIDGARKVLKERRSSADVEQLDFLGLPPEVKRRRSVAAIRKDMQELLEFVRAL